MRNSNGQRDDRDPGDSTGCGGTSDRGMISAESMAKFEARLPSCVLSVQGVRVSLCASWDATI
jgi:hypothetical protein